MFYFAEDSSEISRILPAAAGIFFAHCSILEQHWGFPYLKCLMFFLARIMLQRWHRVRIDVLQMHEEKP